MYKIKYTHYCNPRFVYFLPCFWRPRTLIYGLFFCKILNLCTVSIQEVVIMERVWYMVWKRIVVFQWHFLILEHCVFKDLSFQNLYLYAAGDASNYSANLYTNRSWKIYALKVVKPSFLKNRENKNRETVFTWG